MMTIDIDGWQSGPNLVGDDEDDTASLRDMYSRATTFIRSFKWSPTIKSVHLGFGVGGVVALFLVEFVHAISGSDDKLWVVVGDLPTAYMVTDEAENVKSALIVYCEMMSDWIEAVLSGKSLENVYPVDSAATKENALSLADRVKALKSDILPLL